MKDPITLPIAALVKIVSYLTKQDLKKCQLISTNWRDCFTAILGGTYPLYLRKNCLLISPIFHDNIHSFEELLCTIANCERNFSFLFALEAHLMYSRIRDQKHYLFCIQGKSTYFLKVLFKNKQHSLSIISKIETRSATLRNGHHSINVENLKTFHCQGDIMCNMIYENAIPLFKRNVPQLKNICKVKILQNYSYTFLTKSNLPCLLKRYLINECTHIPTAKMMHCSKISNVIIIDHVNKTLASPPFCNEINKIVNHFDFVQFLHSV